MTRKRQKSFEHLTPNSVTDLAYCVHLVSDDSTNGLASKEIARRTVEAFKRNLKLVAKGSDDEIFLISLCQIIVSLANGISRSKREYAEKKISIAKERNRKIQELSDNKRQSGFFTISIRTIRAALVGGLWFALVKFLASFIELPEQSSSGYISLAIALGMMLLGSYVDSWLTRVKVTKIFDQHERKLAVAEYNRKKELRLEYLRAKDHARKAWERYTGRKIEDVPGYEIILEEEMGMNAEVMNSLEMEGSTFRDLIRDLRIALKRRKQVGQKN